MLFVRASLSALLALSCGWSVALAQTPVQQAAKSAALPRTTVFPPSDKPGALTPAPMPSIMPATTDPDNRAGNAVESGPLNATPLSASVSGTPSASSNGRAEQQANPTEDPIPGH